MQWNWQHKDWPNFTYDAAALSEYESQFLHKAGIMHGSDDNAQVTEIVCFDDPDCISKLKAGVNKNRLMESLKGDSLWKPLPQNFNPETWEIPPVQPTSVVKDGDRIDLGDRVLEVIHTPGHSPGSICLLDKENKILFTGDTFVPGSREA